MSNEIQKIQDEKQIVDLQKEKIRALYNGGLVPKGCSEREVYARIVAGAEMGMKPLQALNGIAMINGRPTLHSDSIPCVVMASGLVTGMHYKFTGEGDNLACTFYVRRKGIEEYQEWTYSMQDAIEAGVASRDTWKAHKKKMLFNRARSWCLRNTFPDVLGNIYTKDEVEDMQYRQSYEQTQLSDEIPDEERYEAIPLEQEANDEAESINEQEPISEPEPKTVGDILDAMPDDKITFGA